MEVKSDSKIRELYTDMMESMARLVRNEKDAFSIIWFDIYGWLEPDRSDMKADLCGILTEKITGENMGEQVYAPIQEDTDYYRMVQTKYALGGSVSELGEYWQELIRGEKYFRLKILYACLDHYYMTIMPYVRNEMIALRSEAYHGAPELLLTSEPYREHRAKIRAAMQVIRRVLDILLSQRAESGGEEKQSGNRDFYELESDDELPF